MPLSRLVAIAMFAVVVSFAATMTFSQLQLRPITERALTILGDATPGLEHIAAIDAELLDLNMNAHHYVDLSPGAADEAREAFRAARRRIATEIEAYRALPAFPGESERVDAIVADLALLDAATDAVMRAADAGAVDDARAELHASFRQSLQCMSNAIADLRKLNGATIERETTSIVDARNSALRIVAVLGMFSVAIAILATLLVIRALRSRTRLISERDRLLAARATELEAFAGRVAHDLRNPLSAISMRASLLLESETTAAPAVRDGLTKIVRHVGRTVEMIHGMLEFARAGASPTPGASADLATVLDDVLGEARLAAEQAQVELDVAPYATVHVACAPAALASVLSNLLGNAVKYVVDGKQAPRRISVRIEALDHAARVEIADNGPGLPAGSGELVFEPFRRLATDKPGIGLGLATVKKIVEAYGGRIGVRSKHGDGAMFWFELPTA